MINNIFNKLPRDSNTEEFFELFSNKNITIERIVSPAQSKLNNQWYDQKQDEWILLLQGSASLEYTDKIVNINKGDYLHIPAHCKHRVIKTDEEIETIWLAIFFN